MASGNANPRKVQKSALTFRSLGFLVEDLTQQHRYADWRESPCQKAVKAIFTTISQALKRGEEVKILGLGTFKVRVLPAKLQRRVFFYGSKPTGPVTIEPIAERRRATFEPHKDIVESLNAEDHDN